MFEPLDILIAVVIVINTGFMGALIGFLFNIYLRHLDAKDEREIFMHSDTAGDHSADPR